MEQEFDISQVQKPSQKTGKKEEKHFGREEDDRQFSLEDKAASLFSIPKLVLFYSYGSHSSQTSTQFIRSRFVFSWFVSCFNNCNFKKIYDQLLFLVPILSTQLFLELNHRVIGIVPFHIYLISFHALISITGRKSSQSFDFQSQRLSRHHFSPVAVPSKLSGRGSCSLRKYDFLRKNKGLVLLDCLSKESLNITASATESINLEQFIPKQDLGERVVLNVNNNIDNSEVVGPRPEAFRNRFLNFVQFGSIINDAAESFFKSEIRRRLFVTAVLIVMSRLGYFIPLPGFDRRLMPENYLSFVSGSVGEWIFIYLIWKL